jgi:hypothetical protein
MEGGMNKTYEYGVRLDDGVRVAVWDQIIRARRLYNELIAAMRGIYDEMQAFTIERAGTEAAALLARIQALNEAFKAARADNDEPRMKMVAEERRGCWRELSPLLKAARKEHKTEIGERFLVRIGKSNRADTYHIRCRYADEGMGFGTANAVLDRALKAWNDSMAKGKPPMFSSGAEKRQDTLVLQFTKAGGIPAAAIMAGQSKELAIDAKPGKRRYGTFAFRLGAAKAKTYATGEIQLHRPLPEGASIPGARLVCKKVADGEEYRLQLVVNDPAGVVAHDGRKPLLAVHFGWAAVDGGRHIATVNDTQDPSTAQVILLPGDIEDDLDKAAAIQSARDTARDALKGMLGQWPMTGDEALDAEISAIQKLPAQYISQARLHGLIERCWREGHENQPDWLREWKALDNRRWQATVGVAQRARNRRGNFYTELAIGWCSQYQAIVIEPLSLKEAAVVVDEMTGERTEFAKKARAGRVVAAVSELAEAIRWQAIKHGTALLEENPPTVSTCSHCGSTNIMPSATDALSLCCQDCGAETGRKANASAVLFQSCCGDIAVRTERYHAAAVMAENAKLLKKANTQVLQQEARRKTRMASDGKKPEGFADNGLISAECAE